MPYTPPSQRSPASSNPNSPVISRTQSYVGPELTASVAPSNSPAPSPSTSQRPALPRSVSSTSYLNKHRRTPSLPQNISSSITENPNPRRSHALGPRGSPQNGSLRQSPPPVNNLLIPTGAITTPPDSAQGSDDDDERSRQWGNLAELQEALSSIEVRRDTSPNREGLSPAGDRTVETPQRPSLTPEARKISHSRSSSDVQLSKHSSAIAESQDNTSDSDIEDDELRIKPPLLRKKSGELVKPALRPSSRRRPSSMPGTPTFSKAVHFNDNIEQVRHFLQVDKPSAVSAGSSPVETAYDSESEYPFEGHSTKKVEWEIRLANFPRETFERKTLPVRVERIFLSADTKTLIGTVAVANISFHKTVIARFTLDYWKTTSEIVAEYNNDVRKKQINDGYDRFNFNIKLADQANLESKTLLLCVRYNVDGQEHWDNNANMNYQVDFVKKTKQRASTKSAGGSPGGAMGAIPRSRHSPPASRPRSFPSRSFDDDFGHGFDPKYQFGQSKPFIKESPNNSIKLKPKSQRPSIFPDPSSGRGNQGGQAFSTRYDFGASLSAALTNAQNALGERSGIKPKLPHIKTVEDVSAAKANVSTPVAASAPSSEKPGLQSAEYNELIQKFCFFGSGSNSGKESPLTKPLPTQQLSKPNDQADGSESDSSMESEDNSGSNSPPSPIQEMSRMFDGASDRSSNSSRSPTHFLSRSSSPGPLTGYDIGGRTQSHLNFGYPYNHSNVHGSILGDSHTPQPIIG